ncbi:unnamed protein product [Xylocopa violacea]
MSSHVWFDRKAISIKAAEDTESINSICNTITELIDNENSLGILNSRIVVAGFSMGGALSLYLSYKYKLSLAGCCATSSFLNKNSLVYQNLKDNRGTRTPSLLQIHGTEDPLVPIQWAEETYNNLKQLGVNTQFVPIAKVDHMLSKPGIETFKKWLLNILPEM